MLQPKFTSLLLAATLGGGISAVAVVGYQASQQLLDARYAVDKAVDERPAQFASYASPPPENFRRAAKRSMAGVVHISTIEERAPSMWDFYSGRGGQVREGTGSGVLFREDGYIVTNNHVIDGANRISVSLEDNRQYTAELIGTYPAADLAVLKIAGEQLPALSFADSDAVEVGDWVLAVGNPYNLSSTVTAGIVSARGRDIDIIHARGALESFIQTDAAINPGNSGGALVNVDGDVVGINTAIYSRSGGYSGYGFAIPASLVKRIADDLITTGSYQPVSLGIEASDLNDSYAAELGLSTSQGVLIIEVEDGGVASLAGLRTGDVVVRAANRTVRSIAEFREAVTSQVRGALLDVEVLRGEERVKLVLAL